MCNIIYIFIVTSLAPDSENIEKVLAAVGKNTLPTTYL